jgi:cell division protein FtsB
MKNHIVYITIIVLLLLYFIFGNNGIIEYNRLLKIRDSYTQKISELENSIKEMEKRIELLEKNKEYLEETIRRELNMAKPEEDLYIIDEEVYSNTDNNTD